MLQSLKCKQNLPVSQFLSFYYSEMLKTTHGFSVGVKLYLISILNIAKEPEPENPGLLLA